MKNLGLQSRLLYVSLLPAFLLGLTALGWFSHVEIKEQQTAFEERTLAVSLRVADGLALALETNDDVYLQGFLRRVLSEPNARSIRILNKDGTQIIASGPLPTAPSQTLNKEDIQVQSDVFDDTYRYFMPIYSLSAIRNEQVRGEHQAWLEIEFDYANIRLEHYQTLLANLTLLLTIMLIIAGLAIWLNREITQPIKHMIETVVQIREGHLNTRIPNASRGELGELEDGINAMAETIEVAYNDMQDSVEQATQDLRETLETIEIQNIELDMARREAQQANQIKTEFLANMSHEIRTPLNGIIGFTRLLQRSSLSKKQEDHVSTILSSSNVLLTIINDVLDFCKIEAGKLTLDNRSNNLKDAVEDVITMLHPSSAGKQLETVHLFYSDVPEQLIFDPLRLKQVLTNLINNAIKFTNEGSVVVRTLLEQQQGNQVTIRISVTDTGIGLNKTQQKALFQAFTQADSSTAREFGGTGLGLVISKRLVEQMGGDIGLESEKGSGSTFWFNLKAEIAPLAQQPQPLNGLADQCIAIVDSRDMSRLSLKHQLENWGAEAFDLPSLKAFALHLKRAANPKPTLAIIEVNEHLKDEELAQKLAKLEQIFTCPIVVISSSIDENFNQRFTQSTLSNVFIRPFKAIDLYQNLLAVIEPGKSLNKPVPQMRPTEHKPGAKILAVDDNAANLKLIVTLLEGMGLNVTSASGGEEALKRATDETFDLIFMDIQMPNMDGMTATRHIRKAQGSSSHTPIIALTAHALAEEQQAMMDAGMDDYLAKPIDENLLEKTLVKWTGPSPDQTQPNIEVEHSAVEVDENQTAVDLCLGIKKAAGKLSLAKDMFQMLIESLEKDQGRINEFYHQGNYARLLETVHRLHGATHYCGVPRLTRAASTTETLLKQKEYFQLEDSLFVLNDEIETIQTWRKTHDIDHSFEQALKDYAAQQKPEPAELIVMQS